MGLTSSAIPYYEVVQFFRRRASFWAVTLVALLLFAILTSISAGLFSVNEYFQVAIFDTEYRVFEAISDGERARYILLMAEFGLLIVLAYLLAQRSISDEIERRSFALLLQTPLSVNGIVIGKLLGLAFILLVVHSIFMTALAMHAPFMRRPWSVIAVEFFIGWFLAVSYLPEGAASALAIRSKGRTYALFRLASLARLAMLMLLIEAAIPVAARQQGIHVWAVLVSYWNSHVLLVDGEHLGLSTIGPVQMVVIVAGWQLLSGLLIWMAFVRGRFAS